MEELRPNDQRAKTAITMIWIVTFVEILSAISGYFQNVLLKAFQNGEIITEFALIANDTRQQLIGIAHVIVYIICSITFIQWFRRAYYNLHLKVNSLCYSEGWAAGSWFVPLLNLFRPFQIMKEIYEVTKDLLLDKGLIQPQKLKTNLLGWWWGIWLVNNTLGNYVFRTSLKSETVEQLISVTNVSIVSSLIGIPLAIITVKIIKDYADVQSVLAELKDDEDNFESMNEDNFIQVQENTTPNLA